ncbi:reverse transcriptase domain-containing protein [Tanacetum coccineum]
MKQTQALFRLFHRPRFDESTSLRKILRFVLDPRTEVRGMSIRFAPTGWYRIEEIPCCSMRGARVEKKQSIVEQPLPAAPAADSEAQKQAGVERFDMIQTFHAYKLEEGKSVSSYVLKIKGYVKQLERLGYVLPQDISVGLILKGLTSNFAGFVRNYHMPNMGSTIGTTFELRPYHFTYPERRLTMEEMLYKFIDEGKCEHEEIRAFNEFRTTNELLFKESNNSLSEPRFEVHELLRVIDNALMSNYEVKGVTTRGGKTTSQDIQNDNTSVHIEEPLVIQMPSIPFPRRLRKEKEEAQQKRFLENLKQLHINLPFIEALAQMPKYAKFLKDVFNKKITLRVGDDEVIFDVDQSIKRAPNEDDECYGIDDLDDTINMETQELLANDKSDSFLLKGLEKSINQSDLESFAQETTRPNGVESEHLYSASANEIDEKRHELKKLHHHLEYTYLHGDKSFPIIISSKLSEKEKMLLLQVLEKRKGAIAWKMSDIKGISPSFCTHKILMEDDFKSAIQLQRHLNPKVQDVVKNEIIKLLDSGLIYPILDSSWVSSIHVVPKKGGIIDISKFQSHLKIKKRNCSLVLMGLFLIDECRLDYATHLMLARCEETNLVLNWKKCHFMVKEGIVLGHKISRAGIEVDKAKIDVIAKLPYPTNVKGVRSFLGHAGLYRRFIKDFSIISKPMTQLLMKDAKLNFSDDCKKAFNILKEKLTTTPIIISPDWNVPFELMCDASDFAVGVVLGQRIDEKFKPIYYASKTLNNAQENYTTTENNFLQLFSLLIRKKGAENLAADHLSRLENPDLGAFTEEEIADEFPNEHLMILKAEVNDDEPWYVDYVNYIVGKIVPPRWTPKKRRRFFSQVKNYFWDEPYAFKLLPDNVMKRCVARNEILEILAHRHSGPTGGHHSALITRRIVYESGFFWRSIFKDAKDYVMRCDACQRSGNISSRSEMPQNNIQVKAQALPTNDARVVIKNLRRLFARFGVS